MSDAPAADAPRRARRRAVLATEIAPVERERLSSGSAALDRVLGGGFAFGQVVLVWGAPGAGKSRLTSRWATRDEPALFVTLEMPAELARDAAVGAGAEPSRLYLLDSDEGWRDEAERLGVRLVVFDSVTEARDPLGVTRELSRWAYARRGLAFAIAQRNSRGRAFGGPRGEHAADTTLAIQPRRKSEARVRVLKSRFCPRGSAVVSLV